MLQKAQDLSTQDLSKGLNTNPNLFSVQKNQTPNCMNVNFNYDGSVEKRLGSNTQNSVQIVQATVAGFSPNSGNTLQNQLMSWWTMDETSGTRFDSMGSNNISQYGNVLYSGGIKNQAALFNALSSQYLACPYSALLSGSGGFTINTWVYLSSTSTTSQRVIAGKLGGIGGGGIDSNTVLMLHCDGVDGSTSFPDSSGSNHTVTPVTNAKIKTDQSKFGGASAYFGNDNSYLTIPDSSDWSFGSDPFTIDFWYRTGTDLTDIPFISHIQDGTHEWAFHTVGVSPALTFEQINGSFSVSAAWSPAQNTWYHIALTKDSSSNYRFFVNGTQVGVTQNNTTAIGDFTGVLQIGKDGAWIGTQDMDGYLDEIRISKGVARWTSNFTVPASAYSAGISSDYEYEVIINTDNKALLRTSNVGTSWTHQVVATSLGAMDTSTWYNIIAYYNTAGHIGILGNLSLDTASCAEGILNGTGGFYIASESSQSFFDGRIDETGFWNRVVTYQNQTDLYNVGSGNTYGVTSNPYPWACFDFGASSIRWLTCAAGTGIYASSNMGVTWVNIASDRTATYQYLDRSKNILIATSDNYDTPLAWTGSAGTYATILNASAPLCKYSINFNGYLILLNSNTSKKSFNYIDENLQMTGSGWLNFDMPSSADDEVTCGFVLRRYLYVSTRYALFRVSYVGGNPDWQYIQVKNWGFIPRTVKKIVLANMQPGQGMMYSIGEVAMGLTWDRKIRIFDGSGDQIVSNNIEQDNGQCDFTLSKISYFGSGPIASFAETDANSNVYRLAVVIGQDSQQTTHWISYDGRALGFYPWDNMNFNCMCMAESANRRFLLAFDRSGRVHMMDSGNLDGNTYPINDYFDSPYLFNKTPSQSSKGHRTDLYFINNTAGTVMYLDRIDGSDMYIQRRNITISGSGGKYIKHESIDMPQTYNMYQFRVMSSGSTSNPWKMIRYDHFMQGLGIGVNP